MPVRPLGQSVRRALEAPTLSLALLWVVSLGKPWPSPGVSDVDAGAARSTPGFPPSRHRSPRRSPLLRRREDCRPDRPVAFDDCRVWVAEAVVAAALKITAAGRSRSSEFRRARRRAAVVRGLQDDQSARLETREDRVLAFSADIAGQHHRDPPQSHLEHHRVVVSHPLALPVGRRGMQDPHFDVAQGRRRRPWTVRQLAPRCGRSAIRLRRPACGGTGTPSQICAGGEVPHHAGRAEQVIGIAVRDDEAVRGA